ncbi:AzlD family protein [Pleomorphomonas oryzae]|uniref:AzlD family protein n=1 Tax=Pleomorphomonas oryzae TaxID=261934 RepID=UPI000422FE6C|nr:AzlD domain-containing protein [Pleomorphomonas oryzae]
MTIDPVNFTAILAMGVLTYMTRILGFLIADRLPKSGPVRVALDALPPAVLVAVVAPIVLSGPIEAVAGLAVLLLALRLPLMATVVVGVGVAALLRLAFL